MKKGGGDFLYETGEAVDFSWDKNPGLRERRKDVERFLKDSGFVYGQEEMTHFHLQSRPGKGDATVFATGIR